MTRFLPTFCPRCHHLVEPPAWVRKANIKCTGGITVVCGYCKPKRAKDDEGVKVSIKYIEIPGAQAVEA